jgi:predicted dehydrogenase
VAAADPEAAIRREIGRRYGIPVIAEAAEVVEMAGVDALVIASPTPFHVEHALLAIAASKPFYLEKPMAASAVEARRLLAALSTSAPRPFAAFGFNYRLSPVFQEARRLVRAGALGELLAAQLLLSEPLATTPVNGWRQRRETGGGAGLELASHQIDLVRWLLDTEIVAVISASATDQRIEQQRMSIGLRLASGVEVHCLALFGAGPRDRVELVGSEATLTVDRHRGTIVRARARRRRYGARASSAGSPLALGALRLRRLVQPSWEPSFGRAMATFAAALGGDESARVRDLARLEDGAASLAVVLAAEASTATGRTVVVEPLVPAAGG